MGWTPKQLREAVDHAAKEQPADGYEASESGLLVPEESAVLVPDHIAAQRAQDALTMVPCVLRNPLIALSRATILRGFVHVTTKVLERPWCGARPEGHVFHRLSPEELDELKPVEYDWPFGKVRHPVWCGFCIDFTRMWV